MGEQTEFDLSASEEWEDPTEDCEVHAGIECEGSCPCRNDCCYDEDEDDVE